MLFICSRVISKSWSYSLLFRGQRTLTSSTVNWMMKRRNSPPQGRISKKPKTKMAQSTDNNFKSAHESKHASSGNVTEVTGDLFSCPNTHSLAHCISADVEMGKGIAVAFKKKFSGIAELFNQRQGPGGLAVLKREDRFIYYLVTKVKYWQKPTYDTLRSSLEKMRDHNVENGVKHLSMPKIGCGLDRLEWLEVLPMIQDIYKGLDIQITIYHFDYGKKNKGKGKQRKMEDGSRGNQHGWTARHDSERKADRERGTQEEFYSHKEDQHSSHHNAKWDHRRPDSGRRDVPSNQRGPRGGAGGSAEHGTRAGGDQEYGLKLPPNKEKTSQHQSNIQKYFPENQSGSRRGKETYEVDFPSLGLPGTKNKQSDKETRRNQGDQQHKTPSNKTNTTPVKINRANWSGGCRDDETQGLGNDGVSTDVKKDDGNEGKVDGTQERKGAKNEGEPPTCEGGNEEENKNSVQSNQHEKESEDKATNSSKEQGKESHEKDRDENAKNQTCPEEDQVSLDTDKNREQTDQSKTLEGKEIPHPVEEDTNAITRNESHSESKNVDAESSASASESTAMSTPEKQERDGEDADATPTDGSTAKSIREQGKDGQNDEKMPSGAADVKTNTKKKKKRRKRKDKLTE